MPNRQVHQSWGSVSGASHAALRAHDQQPLHVAMRAIGGSIGGRFGGRFPDVLEPASWPDHRHVCHSVAFGVGLGGVSYPVIKKWENHFHQKALEYRHARHHGQNSRGQEILLVLRELFMEIVAGLPAGFVAGYTSHLVLDAREGGIPLVGDIKKTIKTREIHNRRKSRR